MGGHLRGGSPIVYGGIVFVPVDDLNDGASGGVVALDARSGQILWEHRVRQPVHNALRPPTES